ncbi:Hypothetical protein GLP15_1071 [Giardia lamblia P15]|uniref:Uncharacterized protein n=1 Tax=Giardia intestinalis (strain P15) TaxID=658858 RepID=E1F2M7_GIAIA|nr:Hypothetical protein GLP15_1071 [Giardia lamblia P15]
MDENGHKIRPFPPTGIGADSRQGSINNAGPGQRSRGAWPYISQYSATYPDTASASLCNPYQTNFTLSQAGQPRYSEHNGNPNTLIWTPSTSSLTQEIPNVEQQQYVPKDRLALPRHSLQPGQPHFVGPFQDSSSYTISSFENNPQFQPNNPSAYPQSQTPTSNIITQTPSTMYHHQAYVPVPSMSMPPQLYLQPPALTDQQSVGYDTISIGSMQPVASNSLIQEILARMRILYTSLFNLYTNSNKIMLTYRNSQVFQVYYDISMTMWYLGKTTSEVIQLLTNSITSSSTLPFSMDANLGLGSTSNSISRLANPRAKEDSVMETEPKATIDAFASIITHTKDFIGSDPVYPHAEITFEKKSTEDRIVELESNLRRMIKHIYGELDVDAVLEAAGLASLAADQTTPSATIGYFTGAGEEPVYSRDVLLAMDKNQLIERIEAQNAIIDNLRHTFSLITANITTLSRASVPSNVMSATNELNNATSPAVDTLMKQLTERTTQLASAQRRLLAAEAELRCLRAEREQRHPVSAS